MTTETTPTYLALTTYGRDLCLDPTTKRRIPALKCTAITAEILGVLYGNDAHLLPHRAGQTYRYVVLEPLPELKRDVLVLQVAPETSARVEQLTRQAVFPRAYLWREGRWWEFPSRDGAEYRDTEAVTSAYPPRFAPTDAPVVNLTEVVAAVEADRVGNRVHATHEGGWWWLTGDTYPHREQLKAAGARWSRRRSAWYFVGATLPPAIQQLATVGSASESSHPGDPATPLLARQFIRKHGQFAGSSEVSWHISGTPTDAQAKCLRAHCVWSEQGQCWQYHGDALPADLAAVCEASPTPTVYNAVGLTPYASMKPPTPLTQDTAQPTPPAEPSVPDAPATEDAPTSTVRTISPPKMPLVTLPDTVDVGLVPVAPPRTNAPMCIGQQYVGALTGSISGNVHCYGYAVHEGVCMYLNMGGPRMAVEAIRAKLAKGETVNLVPWDAPAVELSAGEGNSGMYTAYLHHLPEARFTSAILVHRWLTEAGDATTTYLVRTDDVQAMHKAKHLVTDLLTIPVFEAWTAYLWHAGQQAGLVVPATCGGGIDLLAVSLDAERWTHLITGGLAHGAIRLPLVSAS